MTFSALSSAWLFALLVPLVIFYFLKLRRPRKLVPSLVLWRQVMADQRVNSPFQRFKRNLLLLLQIILLTLLALAAMQPLWKRGQGKGPRLPVLIDISASMGALDKSGGRSRLDEAKARVKERIASLPADAEICLIAFSGSARRLTGFTNNQGELRDALAALEVEEVPGSLDEALRLTQALARTAPFERALVLTDGNLPAKTSFDLPFQLDMEKLTPAGPNAGITSCNARRTAAGGWELFVQIGVTDPPPANSATVILTAGEKELAREQVTITPGAEGPRLGFSIGATGAELLRVRIEPAGFDSLVADNEAWMALPALRPLEIFAPESLAAVRHALTALNAGNEQVRVFPEKGAPSPVHYDLALTAGEIVPASVLVTFGAVPEPLRDVLLAKQGDGVRVVDWRRDSPLLQHVSLDEVLFVDDPQLSGESSVLGARGFETLIDGPHGPLALAARDESGEPARIHLLFHPDRSTLPYRVGFPVLIRNLTLHAARRAGLAEAAAVPTGVLPEQPFPDGVSVAVNGPGKISRTLTADTHGLRGVAAPRAGEYRFIASGASTVVLGASVLSASESSLKAVDTVEFGDRVTVSATATAPVDWPLWRWLAALAFAVLLAEWWWFQRRAV